MSLYCSTVMIGFYIWTHKSKLANPAYLYRALPASTAIQSIAKSICLTKGDMRMATVWATLSTTLGCSRIILKKETQTWAAQILIPIYSRSVIEKSRSHNSSRATMIF